MKLLLTSAGVRNASIHVMDDESAIRVVDGKVDVVSEGHWLLFGPNGAPKGIGARP